MTTLQDQIDYTEKVIRENDEKKKLSGLPEDTIAFMDKDKYLENKE